MMDKILLAGFGGQGVMFIGKVMAYSGMLGNLEVCWIPSYGPEMRGGTANCAVIISTEEINSPVIEQADYGIVLNQPSYDKFINRIKAGGVLVVNSSIVNCDNRRSDIELITIPAGEMANELGNQGLANMLCLGALLGKMKLINFEKAERAMKTITGKKPEMFELNMAAIKKGMS